MKRIGTVDSKELRVLATLVYGEESYRVFADLIINHHSNNQLRVHRFDDHECDSPSARRQVLITVPSVAVRLVKGGITGVEHVLLEPVQLDRESSAALFGLKVQAAA